MNTCKLAGIQVVGRWVAIVSLAGILSVTGCQRSEPTVGSTEQTGPESVAPEVAATEVAAAPDDTASPATVSVEETVAQPVADTTPDQDGQDEDAAPATFGPAAPSRASEYLALVGRWVRTDSPYRIEIRAVGRDGRMEAAYFNPNQINVSRAVARNESGELQVFVELRDVNYPGATYTLAYRPEKDLLQGVYYQPAMKQSFNVSFARQQTGGPPR